MAIAVRILGVPSLEVAGEIGVEPGAEGLSLRSLISDCLAALVGPGLPGALLDAQGELRPEYAILVDGRSAVQLGGLECWVRDGSAVLITALASGG